MIKTMFGACRRAASGIKNRIFSKSQKPFFKKFSVKTMVIAPCAFTVTVVLIMALTFNISYAFAVTVDGETIGYVSSQKVYTDALEEISEKLDDSVQSKLSSVDVREEVTAGVTDILDEKDLKKALVDNMEDVSRLYGLFRNEELFAVCRTREEIENSLETYLEYFSLGLENHDFVDTFTVKEGLYSERSVMTGAALYDTLTKCQPEIGGYRIETTEETIPYKTKTVESDKYLKGEKVVTYAGKNGVREITNKVFYAGDAVYKTVKLSETVKKKAIYKVITVGTGTATGSFKMSFPLKKSDGYTLGSLYGEGRGGYNHHGIDILADYGVNVYAAAGGKVVEAGYSSFGWGNTVLIEHANGLKTRYAHCSALNVSVGDTVSRGEKIGEVGSTGDSDGNHCHFEVYKNGSRVDPMIYLK